MVFISQETKGKRCVRLANFQSPTLTPDSRKKGHFGPRLSGIMGEPFGVDLAFFYSVSLTPDWMLVCLSSTKCKLEAGKHRIV